MAKIVPKVGRRVRFATWHDGNRSSTGFRPEGAPPMEEWTGEVIRRDPGRMTSVWIRRDHDGETHGYMVGDILEYVDLEDPDDFEKCDICGKTLGKRKSEDFYIEEENKVLCEGHYQEWRRTQDGRTDQADR